VQFHLINSTSTGIVYSLTGPGNWSSVLADCAAMPAFP
jgi:hypothetical protein